MGESEAIRNKVEATYMTINWIIHGGLTYQTNKKTSMSSISKLYISLKHLVDQGHIVKTYRKLQLVTLDVCFEKLKKKLF